MSSPDLYEIGSASEIERIRAIIDGSFENASDNGGNNNLAVSEAPSNTNGVVRQRTPLIDSNGAVLSDGTSDGSDHQSEESATSIPQTVSSNDGNGVENMNEIFASNTGAQTANDVVSNIQFADNQRLSTTISRILNDVLIVENMDVASYVSIPATSSSSNKVKTCNLTGSSCVKPSKTSTCNTSVASKSELKTETDNALNKSNDEEDGQCCPICFESWTNSGDHRIASLKCGHLFGQSCIEKWLKGQGGGKCPQCNAKANKKDIRVIFAKIVKMSDTSEQDRAKEALEKEKQCRKKAELESAEARLNLKQSMDELNKLKAEVERYRTNARMEHNRSATASGNLPPSSQFSSNQVNNDITGSFILDRIVKVSDNGGSRVIAYSFDAGVLCISQPSSNALFPGYGVKKLSTLDFKSSQYIAVHSKAIRDIAFKQNSANPYMLTCSVDKTVKVTSLSSNAIVQTYSCAFPVWSCAWDCNDSNYFYAGGQNGIVHLYDIRHTTQNVNEISTNSRSPVISLQYIPSDENAEFKCGGIIIGQLDKCSFSEKLDGMDSKLHTLPIEGSLTSVCFEETSRHVLATLRPSSKHPSVRHQLYKMSSLTIGDDLSNQLCSCDFIHSFNGGTTQKILSKNRLLSHPNHDGNLLVCASDEATQSVHIWDATTGIIKQKLQNMSSVIDICGVNTIDSSHLISLTEKQAAVYKWQ